ncbi:hypothetical protein L596_023396 [Steinernema carpocapsae]|uniref:Uncharacterized protein n=1 Tax=Steinernema carpocapsae TaxID=34508 RepID=A0A4U5MDI3_STECR|nr:hypothetical protein L596_023396 [Steinernema carpocapsae]
MSPPFPACKAATISSAMLARRKSSGSGLPPSGGAAGAADLKSPPAVIGTIASGNATRTAQAARESVAVLAEMLAMEHTGAVKQMNSGESLFRGSF